MNDWVAPALEVSPVLLCGDFNSRPSSGVHRIIDARLSDAFRIKLGRHPKTFASRIPFVCLDFVYLSEPSLVKSIQVCATPLARVSSDHLPVVAEIG